MMPIKPENKKRYPKNWEDIRNNILLRAGGEEEDPRIGARCEAEGCGVLNYELVKKMSDGTIDRFCEMMDFEVNRSYGAAGALMAEWKKRDHSIVVLTIAHLDHTPENCDDKNLKAMCQRCHLAYDATEHKKNAAETRREQQNEKTGQIEMNFKEPKIVTKLKRINNDFYPTASQLTKYLLRQVPEISGVVFEPTSGKGDIANVLSLPEYNGRFEHVITNDIDPAMPAHFCFDAACTSKKWGDIFPEYDWVIGNLPFSLQHTILPCALEHAERGVAILARLSYLEPAMKRNVRGDWLRANSDCMTRLIVIGDPRPNFRADTSKTDSVTTAWVIWDKKWSWKEKGIDPPFSFLSGWKS